MIEIKGKYNTAKIFTENVDEASREQILTLCNQPFTEGSRIRMMPDVHAGAGCTIGTTMTISDKIVPNLVGVDIGCGMETVALRDEHVELQKLDKAIHRLIPSGFDTRTSAHRFVGEIDLANLKCVKNVNLKRAELSIGTLGGGNHFIELGRDDENRFYLVVHSGSRNLGKQVAEYYQNEAAKDLQSKSKEITRSLAFCEGALFNDYLHDMDIIQRYADLNRRAIVHEIVKEMKFKTDYQFTTAHNYIDVGSKILRKGAISARKGERILIPMNMRDGSLICEGLGNPDWNYSAPHGAGRTMSRSQAKQSITLTQFEKSMEGIYSSTVGKHTIDEAPFAYKPMDEIIANISDTAKIIKIIKPVYNFKAPE